MLLDRAALINKDQLFGIKTKCLGFADEVRFNRVTHGGSSGQQPEVVSVIP